MPACLFRNQKTHSVK